MEFKKLYNIDVSGEVKQDYKKLNYLSWAVAYKLMMEHDEKATYKVLEDTDGFPLFSRGELHFVKTEVTMFGETKTMMLPVMDNKHNATPTPNSRQVNDNIQRCLAKNIALFGLGLKLYTGEDLQQYEEIQDMKITQSQFNAISGLLKGDKERENKMLDHFKVNNIASLTSQQATIIINGLRKEVK